MAAINMALTGPYDYLNEKLWITFGDFGFNETLSIIWAAGWCTLLTLPFDNVKTRAMKQFSEPTKNR
jgi:solute carrier family 25 (mitochondrial oxoglutarate transporter), member 11